MKTKISLPLTVLALIFILGTVYFTSARNPASESESYLLPAQAQPAIAGLSTSQSYTLFHSGGEALGGGQEGASESYALRSGFWLGDDASGPSSIYLPLAVRPIPCLTNADEEEPNNTSASATGPLCLNQDNFGTANNGTGNWDYFYFTLNTAGQITVDVTNHPLADVTGAQLLLFYQTSDNQIGETVLLPPYQIIHNALPGTYYIAVYNDIDKCSLPNMNCSLKYTVRVTK